MFLFLGKDSDFKYHIKMTACMKKSIQAVAYFGIIYFNV